MCMQDGNTALHLAALRGDSEAVALLLRHNTACINLTNRVCMYMGSIPVGYVVMDTMSLPTAWQHGSAHILQRGSRCDGEIAV